MAEYLASFAMYCLLTKENLTLVEKIKEVIKIPEFDPETGTDLPEEIYIDN